MSNIVSLDFFKLLHALPCTACNKMPCRSHYKIQITFDGIYVENHMPVCKTHRREAVENGIVPLMSWYPNVAIWVQSLEEVVKREEGLIQDDYERSDFPAY